MKKKEKLHFLDETVKRTKIENARKEAEQIYNYNNWKNNHKKMVNLELKKLNRKKTNVFKTILIGMSLAIMIEIIYILTINDLETILTTINEIKNKFVEISNIIIKLSTPKIYK